MFGCFCRITCHHSVLQREDKNKMISLYFLLKFCAFSTHKSRLVAFSIRDLLDSLFKKI